MCERRSRVAQGRCAAPRDWSRHERERGGSASLGADRRGSPAPPGAAPQQCQGDGHKARTGTVHRHSSRICMLCLQTRSSILSATNTQTGNDGNSVAAGRPGKFRQGWKCASPLTLSTARVSLRCQMAQLGNLATRILVAVIAVPLLTLPLYQDLHELVWVRVFAASLLTMYELLRHDAGGPQRSPCRAGHRAVAVAAFYCCRRASRRTSVLRVRIHGAGALLPVRPGDIATSAERWPTAPSGSVRRSCVRLSFRPPQARLRSGWRRRDRAVLDTPRGWWTPVATSPKIPRRPQAVSGRHAPTRRGPERVGGALAAVAGGFVMERWRLPRTGRRHVGRAAGVGSSWRPACVSVESLLSDPVA